MRSGRRIRVTLTLALVSLVAGPAARGQRTMKPVLFGDHESRPGRLTLTRSTPQWVQRELGTMGYDLRFVDVNSGPINAIFFDRAHGTMWGGSAIHGEDYGVAW